MGTPRRLALLASTIFILACAGASVEAAPAASPEPSPSPAESPAVTPEELDEIERSLAPDGDASPGPGLPTFPAPSAAQGFGIGRSFQTMNPDISFILDFAGAIFSDGEPLQTGAHDPARTGFNLQQLEMSLGSAVDPFLRFDGNIVFGQFGLEIEEAYGTTTALPYDLQMRAGQFMTRFGRLNAMHPHSWEYADQPFILGKFMGAESNRGLGTELSWLTPLPWYTEVIGSVTDAQGGATARSFYGSQPLSVLSPLDLQATGAIKQFFPLSEDWSLAWGLSGAAGPNPTGRSNLSNILGTDLYLKYRPLSGGSFTIVSLTTEGLVRNRQVPGGNLMDYGGYSSLFWRFAQQWGTAVRYEYGSGMPGDYLDPDWTGDRQRFSANVTFWPTEFSRIRLQGSVDRPSWRPEPIYASFLTFEVLTGAHGAHKF